MVKKKPPAPRAARSVARTDVVPRITPEAVRRRAYEIFQAHGGEHGRDIADWFAAEAELLGADKTKIAEASNTQ